MYDLNDLRRATLQADPLLVEGTVLLARLIFSLPLPRATPIHLEGLEELPDAPVLFAMNHSHKYDFVALRAPLYWRTRRHAATWIKTRTWNDPGMRTYLGRTVNVPLTSRGYILAADFQAVAGRRPDEDDYRTLRAFLDGDTPLPDTPLSDALLHRRRDILGFPFHPDHHSWRDALNEVYRLMMEASLQVAREGIARGFSMHIYPQGSVSSRLTRGRIGVIEAALALDLPIIPVGCSGCREVFRAPGSFLTRGDGAPLHLRFGRPFTLDRTGLPTHLRPFHPDDERAFHAPLQRETDRLMAAINDLLLPAYQGSNDIAPDGTQGVARFF